MKTFTVKFTHISKKFTVRANGAVHAAKVAYLKINRVGGKFGANIRAFRMAPVNLKCNDIDGLKIHRPGCATAHDGVDRETNFKRTSAELRAGVDLFLLNGGEVTQ